MPSTATYNDIGITQNPSLPEVLSNRTEIRRATQTEFTLGIVDGPYAGFQVAFSGSNFTYVLGEPWSGEISGISLLSEQGLLFLDNEWSDADGNPIGSGIDLGAFWQSYSSFTPDGSTIYSPTFLYMDRYIGGNSGDSISYAGIPHIRLDFAHGYGGDDSFRSVNLSEANGGEGNDHFVDSSFGTVSGGIGEDTFEDVKATEVHGDEGNDIFLHVSANEILGGEGDDTAHIQGQIETDYRYRIFDGGSGYDVARLSGTSPVWQGNALSHKLSTKDVEQLFFEDGAYDYRVNLSPIGGISGLSPTTSFETATEYETEARISVQGVLDSSFDASGFSITGFNTLTLSWSISGENTNNYTFVASPHSESIRFASSASGGPQVISGDAGDDTITALDSQTTDFFGGSGRDLFELQRARDPARIDMASGTVGSARLFEFEDLATSVNGDTLIGNDLDNSFFVESSQIEIDGMGGSDTYVRSGRSNSTFEYVLNGSEFGALRINGVLSGRLRNIENLDGNQYSDSMMGDAGDNLLNGRGGHDTLKGGDGSDTAIIDVLSKDVVVTGQQIGDQLTVLYEQSRVVVCDDIEFIQFMDQTLTYSDLFFFNNLVLGTDGNDTLVGTDNPEFFEARSGDDHVTAADGDDTIFGGPGNDTLEGGLGDDSIVGHDGDKHHAPFSDSLSGGEGNDTLIGSRNGRNTVHGGLGDDSLVGGENPDLLFSEAGSDTLQGGGAFDLVYFSSRVSGVEVDLATGRGTVGNDTIVLSQVENVVGSNFNDRIGGDDGRNTLNGGAGDDYISGGGYHDVLEGGKGNDTLLGGIGLDKALFRVASSTINVSVEPGAENLVLVSADGTDTVFDDVELFEFSDTTLTYSEVAALTPVIVGTQGNDTLTGTSKDESILGLGGDDYIVPEAGSDTIDGGPGLDMASFLNETQYATVDLTSGTAVSGPDTNLLLNVENITGTAYADTITGDANENRIRGLGDYDWLIGSDGADFYDGGNGRDMISYAYAPGPVEVSLGANRGRAGQADGDRYVSIERVSGSGHGDKFYGGDAEEDFRGLGGYDWFIGSTGGRDRYDGGDGLDTVAYFLSTEGVSASLLLGYGSGGDAAYDLYTSIENLAGTSYDDTLTGNHERNTMRSYAGNDLIFGNGGNDQIFGGPGNDTIDGGPGSDYIQFAGAFSDFMVTRTGTRDATVQWIGSGSGDGTNTLYDVEYLVFDDVTVDIWSL
ncbi:calcium-binding protein [Falsiruegeria mediterranea]|uniref:calcium-binding protein n=1 Tax=Falsiruegeria mediterranea TaxID=1280832 RepID=UPI0015F29A76|nr:calcium-binding protein [Falsiruegeria mediterranea]